MTTIEDKIKLFTKLTYDKIEEEKGKELESIIKLKDEMIKKEEDKVKKLKEEEFKKALKKSEIKANEIIAKAKIKSQQEMLNLKESLIQKVYKDTMLRLKDFTNKKEYKSLLMNIIKTSFSKDMKGEYNLYLSEKDYERYYKEIENLLKEFSDIKINILKSKEDIIGGIIIEDCKNKIKMNNSLSIKLKDSVWNIGLKITEDIDSLK